VSARPFQRPSPLGQMILARVREFYREPEALFWVYGFPLLLAIALGIAFRNRPVERIRVDVQEAPAASESLLAVLRADDRVDVHIDSERECRKRLRSAKTDLVIVPVPDSKTRKFEYWLDQNRPESVLARNAVDSILVRAAHSADAPQVTDHVMEEPGGRYIDFLIPGLLGMNLMGGGLWGVGFVIVDMRIRKLLKRLLATPMRRSQFLLSIALSRMIFTITEVLTLLIFAWLVFGIEVQGSWFSLGVLIVIGAASFMGLGLLVASRAKTTEAVSGLMNLVMLPMYVFSGVFFSSDRFPELAQPFIKLLPLTALNDSLRAVMLDGSGIAPLWQPIAILIAWGAISFALAVKWFRWT